MHNIVYDKNKKALIATLSGNISVEQGNAMLMEFKQSAAGINPRETKLIIHQDNLTASLFILPILQSFLQLVGQLRFKEIYLVNSEKYASMIKQSLSNYGIENSIRYASTVKEVLSN